MHARLHGGDADAQDRSHLGRRPALDVPHDQGGAIERWHGFEGRAQDEPYVDAPGGVVDGDGPVDDGARMASVSVEYREHLIESELETLTAPAPGLLEGRIGDDPIEPRSEGRLAPERVDLANRVPERVLDDFL